MILQDRGHPAQTSHPRRQATAAERENFPGWISALEPFPFHNIPAAPGAGSEDESMVGFHVPVYRTQTGCGVCADPIPGNLPIRRAATAQGTFDPFTVFGTGAKAGELLSAGAGKPRPFASRIVLFGRRDVFYRGRKIDKRVACIGHHRLQLSATIFYSRGTLASLRCGVVRPEARGAGANRIATASNQARDPG